MTVREQYDTVVIKARDLATKAAGREFTPEELAAAAELQHQAAELEPKVKQLDADLAVKSFIDGLGIAPAAVEAPGSDGKPLVKNTSGAATKTVDRPSWSAKRRTGSEWVKTTAERLNTAGGPDGAKAITTGSVGVPTPIQADIVKLPEHPVRLLDLLVDRQAVTGTGDFSFLRQTVRTHNAAPVADNALKPTSVYTFAELTDKVHVLAHLSEKIPIRFLSDYAGLEQFLTDEMERGLVQAVEDQVLSGDGLGENMTGILQTSGVLAQTWNTDLLTTLRKAITAMEIYGELPNAWAIHPSDVEVLDLLQDNEARMYYDGPQQQIGTSPVWSLPIVRSLAVPAGQAILADWNYVRLMVREEARLDFDRSGELFTMNQFIARLEGRYGCAVLRPSAFCIVDTAAPVAP